MSPKTSPFALGQTQTGKLIRDIINRAIQSEMQHMQRQAQIFIYRDTKPEDK